MPKRPPIHQPIFHKSKQQKRKEADAVRGTAHERGYGYRWQQARAVFIKKNPLCAECEKRDRIVPATVVDHIIPHKGNKKLFWDWSNWQSLCKPCHDRKTMQEGSFGH